MEKDHPLCPLTNSPDTSKLFTSTDYLTGDAFSVWQNNKTGLLFTYPKPGSLSVYYPSSYRNYSLLALTVLKLLYGLRVKKWLRHFQQPGLALEIGCGDGFMLKKLQDAGWRVVGTERTPTMLKHAVSVFDLPVFAGTIKALPPQQTFDLIIMYQVLEHLENPLEILSYCEKLLKPGGMLVIGVPNNASWQAKLFGPLWLHLDVPRHLFHYTPSSLGGLLNSCGFQQLSFSTISIEHDPYGWVQSILNWVGFRKNHLTRFLSGIDNLSIKIIVQIILSGLLLPLIILTSLISWIVGRGAIMEAQSIKGYSRQ